MADDNVTAHASSDYDATIGRTIPHYETFHRATIALVAAHGPEPGVWVDTGGGTGTLVEQAHRRFPTTRFYLADPSAAMLAHARDRLSGLLRVTIMDPVDSQGLHLSEPADVVTAVQVHHYLSATERTAATRNCRRLLRDGGLFVTFENVRPSTPEATELARKMWEGFQLEQGRSADVVRRHLARFDVEYFPLTVDEHLRMLRECGFAVVELLWYSVMQAGFYCVK